MILCPDSYRDWVAGLFVSVSASRNNRDMPCEATNADKGTNAGIKENNLS
jgi:hypothetical protein